MLPEGPGKRLAAEVATLVHAEQPKAAAVAVADFCKIKIDLRDNDPKKYTPLLLNWLHYLLNSGAPEEAAQLLWTPTQFTPEPQFTKDLWQLFNETSQGLVMGAASCCKSYAFGVRLYLEYIRDPEWTSVKVVGPSHDHLEQNLFSHLVGLHNRASLPMPGTVGELFIGLDRRNQQGAIRGVIIPVGQVKKAGRLQGAKRVPRPKPHPIFGDRSRMYVMLDELENIPGGLWKDIDNILTQLEEEGGQGFKIFGAYNPTNQTDEVGKRAEPPFGWENINADTHFRWKSRRGWDVLRLDGEKSENVVQGRVVFPGLQTKTGLEAIAKNAGGRTAPGYLTMGRGMYPIQGAMLTVVPPGMFPKWRGEFIWYDEPQPAGACDLAFEGGAAASFTLGRFGKASGMRTPPNLDNPKGSVIMFKDRMGSVTPRWALQADQQFSLQKGDTIAMKDQIITLCRKSGIKPEYFCVDRTGHGSGTADLIKHEWGAGIHAVNYSEGATKAKLMVEDAQTCEEEYDRLSSELWFALRAWGECGYLLINPAMDVSNLTQQVTQRKMRTAGKKSHVESKKDYMSRGYTSPDEADSLTLFVHAARKGSGVTLSRAGEMQPDYTDNWYDTGLPGGQRIDPSNRTDFLELS